MKERSSKSSKDRILLEESFSSRRFTAEVSLEEAASLLQQVAHLASAEVSNDLDLVLDNDAIARSTRRCLFSNSMSFSETSPEQDSPQLFPTRMRTVSISSQSVDISSPLCTPTVLGAVPAPLSPPPLTLFSPSRTGTCIGPLRHPLVHAISPPPSAPKRPLRIPMICNLGPTLRHVKHAVPTSEFDTPSSRKQKYVGTTTSHKVRGILRHKFSWKNYPEVRMLTFLMVAGSSCI